jgi:hypothetical protein
MDGDGCDWLCKLGSGEPPPGPAPGVPDYLPDGDPRSVGDPGGTVLGEYPATELPLVWTGTEFATAYDGPLGVVRFRRFDATGRQIDAEWSYDEGSEVYDGLDLVWTGEGFGLFLVDEARGVLYVRLEPTGKPVGAAILVEADPLARAPAAAWTGADFALAWVAKSAGSGWCPCGAAPDCGGRIRVKRVALGGITGPTTTVEVEGGTPLNLVEGDDGIGIVFGIGGSSDGTCPLRFVRLADDLAEGVSSGVLSPPRGTSSFGFRTPVVSSGGSYTVGWTDCASCLYPGIEYRFCVARFSASGELLAAPVCNPLGEDVLVYGDSAMAAGDSGFLAIAEGPLSQVEPWDVLRSIRLDANGRMLSSSPRVLVSDLATPRGPPPFDIAWAGDGFGVLYGAGTTSGSDLHAALFFQFLRPVAGPSP